jgi:hypothetical protein
MVCLEPFAPKIWLAKVRLFRRNSKQSEDVNFRSVGFDRKKKAPPLENGGAFTARASGSA